MGQHHLIHISIQCQINQFNSKRHTKMFSSIWTSIESEGFLKGFRGFNLDELSLQGVNYLYCYSKYPINPLKKSIDLIYKWG